MHGGKADWFRKKLFTIQLIASYLDHGKSTQNALEALICYHSLEQLSAPSSRNQLLVTLNKHFQQYSTRPVGFEALRPYVHRLHSSLQQEFIEYSATYAFSFQQEFSSSQVREILPEATIAIADKISSIYEQNGSP